MMLKVEILPSLVFSLKIDSDLISSSLRLALATCVQRYVDVVFLLTKKSKIVYNKKVTEEIVDFANEAILQMKINLK